MVPFKYELEPGLLLALHYVCEHRSAEVSLDRLDALREAGFAAQTGTGWCLTAAGARRIKPHSARLRAELAQLCGG